MYKDLGTNYLIKILRKRSVIKSVDLVSDAAMMTSCEQPNLFNDEIPVMGTFCFGPIPMELEIRSEDFAGSVESYAGGGSIVCEGDTNQEPCEGMVFESPDAAKAFYDEYARRVGFVTRIVSSRRSERDGSIISRRLACNKEGFNLNSRKIGRVRIRNRESKREGCMAMLLVKREKPGKWVVTKYIKDHSHPLVVTFGEDRPTPDEKDKKIQELSAELNRANRRLAACRDQLRTFMKLVEEHTNCLTVTVEEVVQNIRELESEEQEDLSVSYHNHM